MQCRLQDSGARVVLILAERGDMLRSMMPELPGLQHALLVDVAAGKIQRGELRLLHQS